MLSLQQKLAALKGIPASSVNSLKVVAPQVKEASASLMSVVLSEPGKKELCKKSEICSPKSGDKSKQTGRTKAQRGTGKSPVKSGTIGMGSSVIDYLGRVGVIESDLSTQWAVEYPSGAVRFFFKHNKDLKAYDEK